MRDLPRVKRMSTSALVLLKLLLIVGVLMAFGWHQLRDLKRYKDKNNKPDDDA